MPRARKIKPEFFQDVKLARELSIDQRYFYVGLWVFADDEGRLRPNPRRLLADIFPYDSDIDESWVREALDRLEETGRLLRYEVDGLEYGYLTKFLKHQSINRPRPSRFPPPPAPAEPIVPSASPRVRLTSGQ